MKNSIKWLFLCMMILMGILPSAAQDDVIAISTEQATVSQNFDTMYDTGTNEPLLAIPNGWRIFREMDTPRTVGTWSGAASEVMYTGGVSLASNAKNGTYNFGDSETPTDRAIGGLSTAAAGGTRCISVMAHLKNNAAKAIESLTLSYDIENYRKGNNAQGFYVQMYYSADGTNWTSAGDDFYTFFAPDDATAGEAVVPISVTSITEKNLLTSIAAGEELFLAWNLTVAGGTSPNYAKGLSLDNISIAANYASDTSYSYIYAEDVTKWAALYLNTGGENIASIGNTNVNGVTYRTFRIAEDGNSYTLKFTNGAGKEVSGPVVTADKNYYFTVTATEVTSIDDPDTYTGWVDPSRKPFVSSGIYLRGDVNGWEASASWEFSDEGNGTYVLYDKVLNGAFKVADASWSSACNYGSNGTSIYLDNSYDLVLGTNDNISCGSNSYACKRIVLNIVGGSAALLLESDDDAGNLTEVYVIGDLNNWNYMDTSGALRLTASDGVFSGDVILPASSDGKSHWRIYQKLGMGGVWGNQGGADATVATTEGTLEKGSSGSVATNPGAYTMTFDINNGEYTLTELASTAVELSLKPADVMLVPVVPEKVRVLSLNNSLIYYNDQDAVFNDIATAMGKNAAWTKHTLLGKSLNAHWNEGDGLAEDGTKGAKMMVRSDAWSHIILQEQSSLPRTDIETVRDNLKKWIGYIREYCPNPNAVIIVPVNWAYSGDWGNYTDFNATFVKNYLNVAQDLGVVLCPVGVAYQDVYEREGSAGADTWFLDDRHPTLKATYMAACMEYGLIYGVDPSTITYTPSGITAAEGESMRGYASRALNGFENVVNHHTGTVKYEINVLDQYGLPVEGQTINVNVSGGGAIDASNVFTATGENGSFTISANSGSFSQNGTITVAAAVTDFEPYAAITLDNTVTSATENFNSMATSGEAELPAAWRIDRTLVARTVGTYPDADTKTMYSGGTSLASNAKNGTWNLGASNDESDRALGGITTGVADATRSINVYTHILNTGRRKLQNLQVSYDIEKYRNGSNENGFFVQLYYSIDGRNWTSAGTEFRTEFTPDASTAGATVVPITTVPVSAILPVTADPGCDLFLAWNISVMSGAAAASAPVFGIDNFSITGEVEPIPTAQHYIYVDDQTTYAALGLYAWGDSELFGAWPGETWVDEKEINGVTYKVFLLDTNSGSFSLIFNNWNNGSQLADYTITANRDFYFRITDTTVQEIDPNSTGITTIDNELQNAKSNGVYDLQGRRLSTQENLNRGIYIVNGKKLLVK